MFDTVTRTSESVELVPIFLAANDNETAQLLLRKAASIYGLTESVRRKIEMVVQSKG